MQKIFRNHEFLETQKGSATKFFRTLRQKQLAKNVIFSSNIVFGHQKRSETPKETLHEIFHVNYMFSIVFDDILQGFTETFAPDR